ncbi:hypothetical protein L6470_02520 [Prevotella communis]|nr:hypothetical protein [Prevotella communis]UKK59902.1 hypothetical protein L6470_02520 [Prevotella communis]
MAVKSSGRVTEVRLEKLSKVFLPTDVTPLSTTTLVMSLLLLCHGRLSL